MLKRLSTVAALAIALCAAGCAGGNTEKVTSSPGTKMTRAAEQDPAVAQYVASEFRDAPIMLEVAYFESGLRQVNADGSLVRGIKHPPDVGVFQINEAVHGAKAKAMGIDLHTLEGNVKFARYLYDTEGLIPWATSRSGWGRYRTASK